MTIFIFIGDSTIKMKGHTVLNKMTF